MEFSVKKVFNSKENRTEFLLINYDFFDGNDYLAKLFNEEFGFALEEKIDGVWYSKIRLCRGSCIYELQWNEEFGNMIYSVNQSENDNDLLLRRLEKLIKILNDKVKESK